MPNDARQVARATVAAHLERAEFFHEVGRHDEAGTELRRAREADPLGGGCLVRADWLARRHRFDEAVAELEGLLAAGTVNLDPRAVVRAGTRLAGLLRDAHRAVEATRLLQRTYCTAVEHDLVDAPLLVAMATMGGESRDPGRAERLLLGAVRIATGDTELANALAELGRLRLEERRFGDATAALWRAYRLQAASGSAVEAARTLSWLGDLCWECGRTRLAFRAWRNALVRLERDGAERLAEPLRRRIDEAIQVVEIHGRKPELN